MALQTYNTIDQNHFIGYIFYEVQDSTLHKYIDNNTYISEQLRQGPNSYTHWVYRLYC
jgi:hypothetical protein